MILNKTSLICGPLIGESCRYLQNAQHFSENHLDDECNSPSISQQYKGLYTI